MELKLDQAAVQEAVKLAIMEQLGAEGRERLVAQALDYLLREPPKDQFMRHQQPSPLQSAFNQAAAAVARDIVMAEVATDETFKAKVREQIGAAMVKIDEMNFSVYIAEALAEALKKG